MSDSGAKPNAWLVRFRAHYYVCRAVERLDRWQSFMTAFERSRRHNYGRAVPKPSEALIWINSDGAARELTDDEKRYAAHATAIQLAKCNPRGGKRPAAALALVTSFGSLAMFAAIHCALSRGSRGSQTRPSFFNDRCAAARPITAPFFFESGFSARFAF